MLGSKPRSPRFQLASVSVGQLPPTASPPAERVTRRRCARERRQSRDRHRLQRHAFSPPTLCALPRSHQGGRAGGGRLRPGRGRRSGHVRRRHPGREGDGAFAFLARRHRAVDGGRPVPQYVRRGGLSRHLRQDCAWPHHRRVVVRPFARGVPARGSNAIGARQRRKVENSPALRRRQGNPRRFAGGRSGRPTTRPAPAPFMARPTPTRC